MSISTDLVVIGAGPGGYAAAFYAADRGLKVALIDPELNPGGVCVYRGCIPSKALLHVAKLLDEASHASAWGVTFGDPKIDVNKLRTFKDNVVKQLTSGTGQLAKARKITYIRGWATITSPTSLDVAKEEGGTEQVEAAGIRLRQGGLVTLDERDSSCCYARQDKVWVADPAGNRWEVYTVLGDIEEDDHHDAAAACCTPVAGESPACCA